MEPKIFLFTFVYNDRKHIEKLFESIKNQTFSNFIYYLYDDSSTETYDDLFTNLKSKLEKKGINAYFEKGTKKLGINKATEHCLNILKEKFTECTHFMWINSDDWLENNALERFNFYIKRKPNYGIYMSNMNTIMEKNGDKIRKEKIFKNSNNYIIDSIYNIQIFNHFLVNKSVFLRINPNCLIYEDNINKNFHNDIAILFIMSAHNYKTLFINEFLSNFVRREKGASTITMINSKNKINFFIPQAKYIESIDANYLLKYNQIVRISFTHFVCQQLIEKREYLKSRKYFKLNKELFKNMKINKIYLYPLKYSFLLYYFPRIYYYIHRIHLSRIKTKKY